MTLGAGRRIIRPVEESHDVVLSYRGDDLKLAESFAQRLRSAGIRVWVAVPSRGERRKERDRRLRVALSGASACVVLMTSANPTGRQRAEAAAAAERAGSDSAFRLIAVVLRGGPSPESLPGWLGHTEHLDLRNAPGEPKAAQALVDVLRGEAPPPAPLSESENLEDGAQGPIEPRYPSRRYAADRRRPKLRQWFKPLPNRPKVRPLSREDIASRVPSKIDEKIAEQLFDEASRVMNARDERIGVAEAKATTLLGTVAIAASLVVAGAGLILDSAKVSEPWRQILMCLVATVLVFLLLCGYTASRALLKVWRISRPQPRAALDRAGSDNVADVLRDRAIDLLTRAGENLYIADYKLAQVRVAYRWYRLALGGFLAVGVVIAVYVLFGEAPAPK